MAGVFILGSNIGKLRRYGKDVRSRLILRSWITLGFKYNEEAFMGMPIRHDAELHRFHTSAEGHGAELVYRLAGKVMTIVHTGVPEKIAGRGIAAELMKAALAHAESSGWMVVPACSYARAFKARYPEYAHLWRER